MTRHHSCRVSPFGHPRINARLTAPRGISQPPTSFIGSQCQGIHHAPLNTYKHKTNIRNCTSENNNHNHPRPHPTPKKRQHAPTAPGSLLARCSQPLSTNQTPHPTTKAGQQQEPRTPKKPGKYPENPEAQGRRPPLQRGTDPRACCLKAQ